MKNNSILVILLGRSIGLAARKPTSFWHPRPASYNVKHAIEVEGFVPIFFTGGYPIALGHHYKKFRLRASIINGGIYNAEKAGLKIHPEILNAITPLRQVSSWAITSGKTWNWI